MSAPRWLMRIYRQYLCSRGEHREGVREEALFVAGTVIPFGAPQTLLTLQCVDCGEWRPLGVVKRNRSNHEKYA